MSDVESELPPVREALCFLPAYHGRDYAMASVVGGFLRADLREMLMNVSLHMEACRRFKEQPYLDKDHDQKTKMFMIEKFCLVEKEGIFCLGYWTTEGLRLRSRYQGVSASCFEHDKKYPPPAEYWESKKKQVEEMAKNWTDPDFLGPIGCVCIDDGPTFPGTIKTLPLDGAADDLMHLSMGFNSAKISWPTMPTPLTEEPKEKHNV